MKKKSKPPRDAIPLGTKVRVELEVGIEDERKPFLIRLIHSVLPPIRLVIEFEDR